MSSKDGFPCPICSQLFQESTINNHVLKCMDNQQTKQLSDNVNDVICSDDNTVSPPFKRQKLSADTAHGCTSSNSASNSKDCESNKPANTALASIFQPKRVLSKDNSTGKSASCSSESHTPSKIVSSGTSIMKSEDGVSSKKEHLPLAELMRPSSFDEYMGQEQAVGRDKMLRKILENSEIPSFILWGPPGCGKTTLARIIAKKCKERSNSRFVEMSATTSGVADVKETIKIAKNELQIHKRRTVLFIDEIHRFNKLQQDTFLPHVENGTITLIGATTENPSFQVNSALLSRCRVIVLEKLSIESITAIVKKALESLNISCVKNGTTEIHGLCIEEDAVKMVAGFCDGDARSALNAIQLVHKAKFGLGHSLITVENAKEALQRTHVMYDRAGDEHYHCASALQKSIRGSDNNAAIYWMTRMWEGGEDPLFIARRLLVIASEDVGLADSQALPIAHATFQACQLLGRPECRINLAHCTTYLARAPKSNESFQALNAAQLCIQEHVGPLPGVPLHLRNASTKLMKELGYGKGYKSNHSCEDKVQMDYLPKELLGMNFFNSSKKK